MEENAMAFIAAFTYSQKACYTVYLQAILLYVYLKTKPMLKRDVLA